MRIEQIVPYIGEEASGPAWSVPALCSALSEFGNDVTLHVLAPGPVRKDTWNFSLNEYRWHNLPYKRLGRSPEMKKGLCQAAVNADILHNHSLWMLPNIYPAKAVQSISCRLVVSPRGTLSRRALSNSRCLKRASAFLGQQRVLNMAQCFHATSESEYEDIRRAGLQAPVAILPNGISLPSPKYICHEQKKERMTLLFLGRINPIKGVDSLIRTWRLVEDHFPMWDLKIAGPDNRGYLKKMHKLASKLGCKRMEFTGPVYGEDKTRILNESDLFVLPTHSENFGIAVAEALAHELPAIVTTGAPWQGLVDEQCGWWIKGGDESLKQILFEAMSLTRETLQNMGKRGRIWMERDLAWNTIGEKMHKTYQWLINGGTKPEWVKLG